MSDIHGVRFFEPPFHHDDRGFFAEVWKVEPGFVPVQANLSYSQARVCRGMHYHLEQTDFWWVASGMVTVFLHDLRLGCATQGTKVERTLSEGWGIRIPPGVGHGFWALTNLYLCYLVDRPYADGADEHGYRRAWPKEAILSERDRTAPLLKDLCSGNFPLWGG